MFCDAPTKVPWADSLMRHTKLFVTNDVMSYSDFESMLRQKAIIETLVTPKIVSLILCADSRRPCFDLFPIHQEVEVNVYFWEISTVHLLIYPFEL